MPSTPSATPTPITPPRVSLIDPRTGLIDRAWYMFFLSLFTAASNAENADTGPSATGLLASFDAELRLLADVVGVQYDAQSAIASLAAALATAEQQTAVQPPVEIGELQQQIDALSQAVGITPAPLPLNSGAFFNIVGPATAGSVAYGNGTSLTFSAAGSSGQLLTSAGSGAPTWTSLSSIGVTSISFGSTGLTPATATSGAVTVAGTLVVANGGTGVTTATANYVFAGPTSGGAAAPSFRALVSGDIPALSYVSSVSATAPITSTGGLTPTIGVTAAALTKSDDTNVTLTLGGSPTTALLAATSLTLGWTGQLAVSRGGTGVSTATANYVFAGPTSGGAAAPSFRALVAADIPTLSYVTSVTGTSPVVSSGGTTPAISLASGYGDTQNPYASKTANYVLAAPNGSAGVPTFRALAAADIPALPYNPTAAPATYTANFSVATTDVWIINNKSGSSCTATLPTASSYSGRVLYFQNYQAQTLVSASSNVVPVGGGAAATSILLASAGDQCTLVSNGTNWIMMQYVPNNSLLLE